MWRRGLIDGSSRSIPPGEWTYDHEGPDTDTKGKVEEQGGAVISGNPNQGREHCYIMKNHFWLKNCCFEHVWGISIMARPAKSRGRGRQTQVPRNEKELSTSEPRRGRKSVERLISEAIKAYHEGTDEGI